MTLAEEVLASGALLVDVPHPDGGIGLRISRLADGSLAVMARSENVVLEQGVGRVFFIVGPRGTEMVRTALTAMEPPAPEPAPEVRDE